LRYYISDLHFFHEKLNHEMDKRGFADIDEMHSYIIKKWNAKVNRRDEVIILGDLSFGKAEETNELLKKLNGKLCLIRGNHDNRFLKKTAFDGSRFEWVKDYTEIEDNNRKIVLCHYPIMCYNGQYRLTAEGNPKTAAISQPQETAASPSKQETGILPQSPTSNQVPSTILHDRANIISRWMTSHLTGNLAKRYPY